MSQQLLPAEAKAPKTDSAGQPISVGVPESIRQSISVEDRQAGGEPSQVRGSGLMKVEYWPQLDGLRTLAFLLVFIFHSGVISNPYGSRTLLLANNVICSGFVGVDLFFVLSGFLISYLLLTERDRFGTISFALFFRRRAFRIWPLYYTVLLVGGCATLALKPQSPLLAPFFVQTMAPLALFLGNFAFIFKEDQLTRLGAELGVPLAALFLPFWSLCIEEQFYLCWPLLLRRLRSTRAIIITLLSGCVGSTLLSWAFQRVSQHAPLPVPVPFHLYYFNTICHLSPLLLGALVAVIQVKSPARLQVFGKWGALIGALLLVACYKLVSMLPQDTLMNSPRMVFDLLAVALCCALTLVLLLKWKPIIWLFSQPGLVQVGKITFCMYVVHDFVINMLAPYLTWTTYLPITSELSWLLRALCSFTSTYVLAWLSWNILEKRFLKMKMSYSRLTH